MRIPQTPYVIENVRQRSRACVQPTLLHEAIRERQRVASPSRSQVLVVNQAALFRKAQPVSLLRAA